MPENSLSHHHHHHQHGKRRGRQQVPLFVRSDKNVLDFVESEKGVPRFKENVGKSNPFIILETSGTGEKHGRHFSNVIPAQRSKLRGKGTKLRKKKKIGRSRNRFNLKSAEKQAKNRRFPKENLKKPVERLLIGGAGAGEQRLGNFDLLLFVILMMLLLCCYCYFVIILLLADAEEQRLGNFDLLLFVFLCCYCYVVIVIFLSFY